MTKLRKTYLRDLYEELYKILPAVEASMNDSLTSPEAKAFIEEYRRDQVRRIRSRIRSINRDKEDPIQHSMLTGTRRAVSSGNDLSDGPIYFWIETDTGMTDDDCRLLIEEETLRCRSPYDCSGEAFTRYFTFTRTPVGIVFIHAIDYDY